MIFKRTEGWTFRPIFIGSKKYDFYPHEFLCGCGVCQDQKLDLKLVEKLQVLRDKLKKPIVISSGYRCVNWNKAVGGAPASPHLKGWAADIQVKNMSGMELYHEAKDIFTSMGIGKNYLHVDIRDREKLWFYDKLTREDLV
jgi:hypothetical protein